MLENAVKAISENVDGVEKSQSTWLLREKRGKPRYVYWPRRKGRGAAIGNAQALEALRRSEGRYSDLVNEVNGGLFTIDDLPVGRGGLILVIDDEISVRGITRVMLETYGYRVVTASDGAEVITLYAKNKIRGR